MRHDFTHLHGNIILKSLKHVLIGHCESSSHSHLLLNENYYYILKLYN